MVFKKKKIKKDVDMVYKEPGTRYRCTFNRIKLQHRSLPSHGGGGGRGLGRAVPRCRHIGSAVSHGAAAVSCSVVLCWHLCHLCHLCRQCHHDMEGGGASESVPQHVP